MDGHRCRLEMGVNVCGAAPACLRIPDLLIVCGRFIAAGSGALKFLCAAAEIVNENSMHPR